MDGKLRNMTTVYIFSGNKVLLLYRIGSRVVTVPSWCGIGGHFEPEELNDARAAVLREACEEIGVREEELEHLALRYMTVRYKNGEIRQNYYFFANLKGGVRIQEECNEGILEWVETERALERNMPYTAKYVLRHYLEIGKGTQDMYCGIACENGVDFTELRTFSG